MSCRAFFSSRGCDFHPVSRWRQKFEAGFGSVHRAIPLVLILHEDGDSVLQGQIQWTMIGGVPEDK